MNNYPSGSMEFKQNEEEEKNWSPKGCSIVSNSSTLLINPLSNFFFAHPVVEAAFVLR